MVFEKFKRIYAQEPFILRVRALYLLLFNVVVFMFASLSFTFFFNEKEPTYRPSYILFIIASFLSIILLWIGQFKKALFLTLFSWLRDLRGFYFLEIRSEMLYGVFLF